MAIVVNREELLRLLESVQPGLAARETIQQASCFVFHGGNVITYNDEVACKAPQPFQGGKIKGAVRAKKLLEALSKLTEDELGVEKEDGQIVFKGKAGRKVKMFLEAEVLLPIDSIEVPDEWFPVHKEFCEALGVVQECARTNGEFKYVAVHIHPKWMEACDRFQLCRWNLKTGLKKPVLVRKESVRQVTSLAMTEMGETDHWIHFRNAYGLELSCRKYDDSYPDYSNHFDVEGYATNLPKGFVNEADLGQVFSSEHAGDGNDRITVEVVQGKSRLGGVGITGCYEGPWYKVSYDGPPFIFMTSPKMLSSLVEKHQECELSDKGRLKVNGGKYTYLAWLIKPKVQEEEKPSPVLEDEEENDGEEDGDEQED